MISNIPLIDLKTQYKKIKSKIDASIKEVLDHGQFINGKEVSDLEEKLCEFSSVKNTISCANGTDALAIALMVIGVGSKDAVFVPSFTYVSSAESAKLIGTNPFFIDVDDDFNIELESFKNAIKQSKQMGLNPKCLISVDLFGNPSVSDDLLKLANEHSIKIIFDAAQSFGAEYKNKKAINYGYLSTTSFFPAKPLGCFGDGGAIFSNNKNLARKISSIKNHGTGRHKYEHINIGMNSRLDTIQAAILKEKLKIFPEEIKKRNKIAETYNSELNESYIKPIVSNKKKSVWAQYTLRHKQRNKIIQILQANNINTAIYYPIPLHKQLAFKKCPRVFSGLKNSDKFSKEVFSIPMNPYLKENDQSRIIDILNKI